MKQTRKKRIQKTFTAMEKCKAVLAVWSERRTITDTAKEMDVTPMRITKWQDTAMEAILNALESRANQKKCPALNARLEKLLERKYSQRTKSMSRLEQRLEKIQQNNSKAT